MDIKDFILIGGSLLIASVVAHGFWLAWRAHRDPLRFEITPEIPRDENFDEMTLLRGELPNGGARVVAGEPEQVSFELEAPPVLIETPPPASKRRGPRSAECDDEVRAGGAEDEAPLEFGAVIRVTEEPVIDAPLADRQENVADAETTGRGRKRGISVEPILTSDPLDEHFQQRGTQKRFSDDHAVAQSGLKALEGQTDAAGDRSVQTTEPGVHRTEARPTRPSAAERGLVDPDSAEVRAELAQADAAQAGSLRVDPMQEDATKENPAMQGVSIQGDPIQGDPIQGDPMQGAPMQGAPIHTERQARRSRNDARGRSRPRRIEGSASSRALGTTGEFQVASEVLVITVLARRGQRFHGTDLLETLVDNDLRFGDMNIFHRLDGSSSIPQFSVANAVEPGTFDLSDMTSLETPGISFFLQLAGQEEPAAAFDDMLEVARDVAARLGGDLKDENMSVMTGQTVEHYRQRIVDFALKRMSKRA